ncbi:MAG TPA: preprotein translocase subunit YajC [Propionibacteriaceae bacterium]|nr:preprotein translocase subunit YajC [Propionibacteriaceae bacterium]HPZ49169.1 preprotein translocase subunit YajC [Propionibacteriaceae bacterium]HQE31600.1 preprotein translocase subunit YajC [Propionibacteriaceae bacterium]
MDQTLSTVLMFGALLLGGYFLLIRPQQKRAKDQADMIAKLGEGSRVMLTSGVFATIRHMGTKQAIVEVSPGVELTIVRNAIVRAIPAEEEEFEYADDEADLVPDDLQSLQADDDSAWRADAVTGPAADPATDPVHEGPADGPSYEPPTAPDQGADRR